MSLVVALLTSIFSFVILVSCSEQEPKWKIVDKRATEDAEALGDDAQKSYLQCYALDYQNKEQCLQPLHDQYIKAKYKADLQYTRSFQYKLEKLGFLHFLQNHNPACGSINHGPQYVKSAHAYQVNCTCGTNYLMQFYYDKKE